MNDDWEFEVAYFIYDDLRIVDLSLNISDLGTLINSILMSGIRSAILGKMGDNNEFYVVVPSKTNALGDIEDFLRLIDMGMEE